MVLHRVPFVMAQTDINVCSKSDGGRNLTIFLTQEANPSGFFAKNSFGVLKQPVERLNPRERLE